MSRKWYNRLVLGTAVGVFVAMAAVGQYAAAQNPGQIIVTSPSGTELVALQTSGPQSAAISLNNIKTFVGSGGAAGPGAFTTLSATGAVTGAGFTALFASPPAIGGTAAAAGVFTTLQWTTSAGATGAFSTDSGQTATATVCEDTTSHVLYFGSGTAGICKGTSSMRFKEHIGGMVYGLPEIMKLQPVSYNTKAEYGDPTKRLFGFLAEEVATVMPQGVTEYDAKGDPSSVDYVAIIPVLVNAIKEQQAQIDQLKRQVRQQSAHR